MASNGVDVANLTKDNQEIIRQHIIATVSKVENVTDETRKKIIA